MGLPWRGPEPCPSLLRPRVGPVRALPPSSCPSHRGHAQVGPETSHFTPLHVPFPIATQTLATSDCRTPSHNLQSLSAGLVACRTPGQEEKERTIPFGDALMMPPETLGLIFPGPGPLPLLLVRGSLLGSSPMGTSCGGRGEEGEEEEGSKTKSERDVVTRPCCAPRYILPFANQTDSYFLWLNFGFPSAHWIHLSVI